jgi:hypothetical protein
MVLESRQACAEGAASKHQERASHETIPELADPMQMTEQLHLNAVADDSQFQQDPSTCETCEKDEQVTQPETKSQKTCKLAINEAIKPTFGVKKRRKVEFAKESKEFSNTDTSMPKLDRKVKDQDCVYEKRQTGDGDVRAAKPPMMSRAQLYTALCDKPEEEGRRINPNKGKFFFGSTLRLYGGSRWSELRKKAQGEQTEELVSTSQEFKLETNTVHESKRVRFVYELPDADDGSTTLAEEQLGKFTAELKKQALHPEISVNKRYEGNWKASGPAFIVITNELFTVNQ